LLMIGCPSTVIGHLSSGIYGADYVVPPRILEIQGGLQQPRVVHLGWTSALFQKWLIAECFAGFMESKGFFASISPRIEVRIQGRPSMPGPTSGGKCEVMLLQYGRLVRR
jgi:hypothetical protein